MDIELEHLGHKEPEEPTRFKKKNHEINLNQTLLSIGTRPKIFFWVNPSWKRF